MTLRNNTNKAAQAQTQDGSGQRQQQQQQQQPSYILHDQQRHGSTESSGAESWRSTDTVRRAQLNGGSFGSVKERGTPMKVNTNKRLQ